jgi:hypothetical protein
MINMGVGGYVIPRITCATTVANRAHCRRKAHQHTIAAIAAAGTVGAVVTSLWLAWSARRADRTRLRAFANLMIVALTGIDPKAARELLVVGITNQGKWPLRIPTTFFYWKVPFKRTRMVIMPLDMTGSALIDKKSYPVEVAPRASENFFICDLASFKETVKSMRGADTFADRLRLRFIRAFVETDDGETFRVKLSPGVRQVWTGRASDVNG